MVDSHTHTRAHAFICPGARPRQLCWRSWLLKGSVPTTGPPTCGPHLLSSPITESGSSSAQHTSVLCLYQAAWLEYLLELVWVRPCLASSGPFSRASQAQYIIVQEHKCITASMSMHQSSEAWLAPTEALHFKAYFKAKGLILVPLHLINQKELGPLHPLQEVSFVPWNTHACPSAKPHVKGNHFRASKQRY